MSDVLVRSHLRVSESLRCFLDVHLAVENTDPPRRGLIAVVTHHDHAHDRELGSLFVLSMSTTGRITHVLPITEHLTLQVAQTKSLDSRVADSDLDVQTDRSSAWLLHIKRDAQDATQFACVVQTAEITNLKILTAECRRLKEVAIATHPLSTDFTWAEAYLLNMSSRRLDLRLRKQPLHTRLSPSVAGSPGDDIADISIVERDWIRRAADKSASSGNIKHLKIRLGTFNVNGRTPSQDLHTWLRNPESQSDTKSGWISPLKLSPFEVSSDLLLQEPHKNSADGQAFGDFDMLVLGFQELDLSTEALLYTTSTLKEDTWLAAVFAGLGEKRVLYEKLASRQLVGMLLMVIVKKALLPCFTDIWSCNAGSGILGFMGNKGATAIRLEFSPKDPQIAICRPIILTFVNAHLAASDEMVERRNYDFQELSERLIFSKHGSHENYLPTSSAGDGCNIYQSDVLFWMVDLNYRLDLPDEEIRQLLFLHASGIDDIQTLLLYDQLRDAIRNNKAFVGFTEHDITYMPSYRFVLGVAKENGYDLKRKPAWTDRILYMASPDINVAQVAYRSHPEIAMSDHKPVSADFYISFSHIDQALYENVAEALQHELADNKDLERRSKIKIQPVSVEFGTVAYEQVVHREVTMQNESDISCVFRFVRSEAGSENISPSWLRIEPIAGFLRPHATTIISLTAYVDKASAAELNLGPPNLECTLILHTALGKDDFLLISGDYQYTCFANTLERLARLAGPIRRLKSPEDLMPVEEALSAPRETMRLINWMMAHASTTDALFEKPAPARWCHVIRECLDTGDAFPSELEADQAFGAACAHTLVALLDSLIEPVVPPRLHTQCMQVKDRDEAFEVLNAFPHQSINVWISLTAFLHYIAQQGDSNPTSPRKADKLASIFAPVLLRDDPTGVHPRASPVRKRDFLLLFID